MDDLLKWRIITRILVESASDGSLSREEAGGDLSFSELRKLVASTLTQWRNAGAKFVNQETGIVIELSKTGITKTVRVAEPLLRIHFALPYILQRGHLLKR